MVYPQFTKHSELLVCHRQAESETGWLQAQSAWVSRHQAGLDGFEAHYVVWMKARMSTNERSSVVIARTFSAGKLPRQRLAHPARRGACPAAGRPRE